MSTDGKTQIVDTIKQTPETYGNNAYSIIETSVDRESQRFCCLEKKWSVGACDIPYTGAALELVGKLNENEKGQTPYKVQKDNKTYIAKAVKLSRWSKYHKGDVFNVKNLRRSLQKDKKMVGSCIVADMDKIVGYIGMDDYSNELTIGSILHDYTKSSPSFSKLLNFPHTFATCQEWGLYISHHASEGDLGRFLSSGGSAFEVVKPSNGGRGYTALKVPVMVDIISQVACTLDYLQSNGSFIHGGLDVSNVLIDQTTKVNGSHKNVSFGSSGFRVVINDFSNSSINIETKIGTVRVFSEVSIGRTIAKQLGDFEVVLKEGSSCLAVPTGQPGTTFGTECRNSFWWKLPSWFDKVNLLILAHSGIPFYKAIDFYIFMVSICMTMEGYNTMVDATLYKYWSSLWKMTDLPKINNDVRSYHGRPHALEDVLSVIRKYEMRCDILEYVLQLLSTTKK